MLKLIKLRNYGWTNLLYLASMDSKSVLVKKYYFNYKTILTFILYNIYCIFSFRAPTGFPISNRSRIRKEIDANSLLKKLNVNVQRLFFVKDDLLVFENVPGKNLKEFFDTTNDLDLVEKIAYKKGLEVGTIHKQNFALIDNRSTNTIVTGDFQIYSIDHEFFSTDAEDFQKELDLITMFSTVPFDKFESFHKGFSRGYCEKTNNKCKMKRKDLFVMGWFLLNLLIKLGFLK